MAFWSGATLEIRLPDLIVPFSQSSIDCNSYTLHMGDEYYLSVDADGSASIETLSDSGSFCIPAGQFAFLLTEEIVEVPSLAMAFISMKSDLKFRGLVNVSGFHVDPGFKGRLKFAVFNAGPSGIVVKRGDECFLIWYANLDNAEDTLHAKSISNNEKYKLGITGRDVRGISGSVMSLSVLAKKVEDLDRAQNWMKLALWTFTFVSAIVIATITFLTQEGIKSLLRHATNIWYYL